MKNKYSWDMNLITFISLIICFIIVISVYTSFEKSEMKNNSFEFKKLNDNFSNSNEYHFYKMPVKYNVNDSCIPSEKKRIDEAADIISKTTKGIVIFDYTINETDADIKISCDDSIYYSMGNETLGVTYFEYYPSSKVIADVNIILRNHETDTGFFKNNYPTKEVHELLHGFGFKHDDNELSIMYHKDNGQNNIDDNIVEQLMQTYNNNIYIKPSDIGVGNRISIRPNQPVKYIINNQNKN